jgi:hypothetical protein
MWIYQVIKAAGIESYKSYVAEIHPWIDIFDTFKMFICHVLSKEVSGNIEQGRRVRAIIGEQGEPIGWEYY